MGDYYGNFTGLDDSIYYYGNFTGLDDDGFYAGDDDITSNSFHHNNGILIGAIVAGILGVGLLGALACYTVVRKKKDYEKMDDIKV